LVKFGSRPIPAKLRDRNSGSFDSVMPGFAPYEREGKTGRDLLDRVHSAVLADVEQQVMALRALHAKLRDTHAAENFGVVVAFYRQKGLPRRAIILWL